MLLSGFFSGLDCKIKVLIKLLKDFAHFTLIKSSKFSLNWNFLFHCNYSICFRSITNQISQLTACMYYFGQLETLKNEHLFLAVYCYWHVIIIESSLPAAAGKISKYALVQTLKVTFPICTVIIPKNFKKLRCKMFEWIVKQIHSNNYNVIVTNHQCYRAFGKRE